MVRRCALALLLVAIPSAAWAQGEGSVAERLLPAGSQIYFRFDGFDAHRKAFDKTALGKMLQGDTGKFLTALMDYVDKQVDALVGQFDPQAAKAFKDVSKVIEAVGKHGVLFGIELGGVAPPDAQATFVFPRGGDGPLLPLIKRAIEAGPGGVKEHKVFRTVSKAKRGVIVYHVELAPGLSLGWWNEFGSGAAVVTIGTHAPDRVASAAGGPGLAGNPFFKEVQGFNEFTTCARAYVDLAGLLKLAKNINPDVSKLITELGLDGIKGI